MGAFARNRARIAGTSFVLFCISLFIAAYSARNPWTATLGASLSSGLLRPLQLCYVSGFSSIANLWNRYIHLTEVARENEGLLRRLRALEAQNSKLMELESENGRLRSLVGLVQQGGLRGVTARVIGHNASNWMQVLTVAGGSKDGVELGMPALQGNGVAGQVIAVGPRISRVLLITDHSSGIDAIIQGSRVRGVVMGTGEGCALEYVLSEEEVKIGDRVITSGMDGVYPKGLLVGVVANAEAVRKGSNMFQSITVKPAVDFSRLEEMLLVAPILPEPAVPRVPPAAKQPAKKGGR